MVRRLFTAVLLLQLLAIQGYASASGEPMERKKVGVVLSGGGAKGMAHIGVLKVIEKAGIPVDIVTGTSMGSIVGGLYAIGYSASDLDSLVRLQDWNAIILDREDLSMQNIAERRKQSTYAISTGFSFKKLKGTSGGGIIKGKNLHNLFERLTTGYNDSLDFSKLPIPFACVATNIVDNTEYDFHSGYLSQAMRASMAIPAVFAPVRIGDMVLVDGGMRNNYPADLAREMGAEVIIGVRMPDPPKKADDLTTTADMLAQIVDLNFSNKQDTNIAISDLVITVDTKNYSAASFNAAAIDTLIRRGEEEAMRQWDSLIALKRLIGVSEDYRPVRQAAVKPGMGNNAVKIVKVEFVNVDPADERYIRSKFRLDKCDSIDVRQAELITTALRIDLFYSDASYRLSSQPGGMKAVVTAAPKKTAQLNIGARFDTEEMVSMQLNADLPLHRNMLSGAELTLRLGKRLMARLDLSLTPRRVFRPTLSYTYRRDDTNLYENGDKVLNFVYNHHAVELSVLNFNVRNLNITAGLRWDYYKESGAIDNLLTQWSGLLRPGHYYTYFWNMYYNSEDNWIFPSKGAKFTAQYMYRTDDFVKLNGKTGISEVSAMFRKSFGITPSLTLQPMLYGRFVISPGEIQSFGNVVGGDNFGHYLYQQMPFAGVNYLEKVDEYFVALQLLAQQRIGTNHYIQLRSAAGQQAPALKSLLDKRTLLGFTLSYYYSTIFGPVGGSVGYSNKTKDPYFYINLGYVF